MKKLLSVVLIATILMCSATETKAQSVPGMGGMTIYATSRVNHPDVQKITRKVLYVIFMSLASIGVGKDAIVEEYWDELTQSYQPYYTRDQAGKWHFPIGTQFTNEAGDPVQMPVNVVLN